MVAGGIFGGFGMVAGATEAAGIRASRLGATGSMAVAAPLALGAARAASRRFSSSLGAWEASHRARLSVGRRVGRAKFRRAWLRGWGLRLGQGCMRSRSF